MPGEETTKLRLEIAHVLFIDIVGYSKLRINQQSESVRELNTIVSSTSQFRKADAEGKLIRLPTGDGMALVFRSNPEAPAQCALEISQALKSHPNIQLRMGIHSGPVNEVADVNQRANIAGAGINIAQRIMDCGDAGHILISKHAAEDLEHYDHWQPFLHDLGDFEVKHGVVLSVANLYADGVGNPALPGKLKQSTRGLSRARSRRSPIWVGLLAILLFTLAGLALVFTPAILRQTRSREEKSAPSLATTTIVPPKSIAVLPFENLSSDKENAYFADGVQDEILTYLAMIADLKVISRTSVLQYKNAAARNLREIGKQLGVANLLEGSVQRAGNRVRVNAQLIDARTDAHLWAQTYDRDLADVFAIQSEIAKTIAEQLRARLSPSEQVAIAQAPTTDLVAYDLFVHARALNDLANDPGAKDSLLRAVSLLEEAVRRDPKFLSAYCLLCEVNLNLFWGGFDHTLARREQANAALQKAEHIQPDAGEVHVQKGLYAYHGFRNYEKARAEFELALRTLPNASRVYLHLGAVDRRQARWDEAIQNFERAAELDPRNLVTIEEAGFTCDGLRRFAKAKAWFGRALSLAPKDYFVRTELSQLPYYEHADIRPWRAQLNAIRSEGPDAASHVAFAFVNCALLERDHTAATQALALVPTEGALRPYGNFPLPREFFVGLVARCFGDTSGAQSAFTAARTIAAKTAQDQPEYAPAWSLLGMIDAGLGHKTDAIAEGKRACELLPISKDAWDGPLYIIDLAFIYTWVGETDLALEQLATAAKNPAGISYGDLKLSPVWDPLRSDPRFEQIMASLAPKETTSR